MIRINPEKIAHIVYRTHRFDAMLDWYAKVFDTCLIAKKPAIALFAYDYEHHRFAFLNLANLHANCEDIESWDLIRINLIAYAYPSHDELLEHYLCLKREGIEPTQCIEHGKTVSMYYADPDGNQLAFQVKSFSSAMRDGQCVCEPQFEPHSSGVKFSPEDWLEQAYDCTPVGELQRHKGAQMVLPLQRPLTLMT